jgi:hypothetical protein
VHGSDTTPAPSFGASVDGVNIAWLLVWFESQAFQVVGLP